jgi:ATP-dependent RNA helicase DDX51/DBP6
MFFTVQQQVIPWLLESQQQFFRPCDMCVSAPTGSGKTLAFVLPTVQVCLFISKINSITFLNFLCLLKALWRQSVRRLRCLAVLPVHDLAVQVYRVYLSFCAGTNLQVALISGQASFYDEQQLLVLIIKLFPFHIYFKNVFTNSGSKRQNWAISYQTRYRRLYSWAIS